MQPTISVKEIQVKEITEKKSKKNQDYLLVKDQDGKTYYSWEAVHFTILRACKQSGEKLRVSVEEGKYPSIKGIDGVDIPVRQNNASGGNSVRSGEIKKAMEDKKASITGFVERKENSMRRFAILRDATMLTTLNWQEFGGNTKDEMIKKARQYWEDYLDKEIY